MVETPSKRKRGRSNGSDVTPRKLKEPSVNFSTPVTLKNPRDSEVTNATADRSARRKSARRLIERTVNAGGGDEGDDDYEAGEEDELAQEILGDSEDHGDGEGEGGGEGDSNESAEGQDSEDEIVVAQPSVSQTATPSKRRRGRPKGSKNKRTPTPPRDLPAYEHYFFQNRPGGAKTSNNALSSLSLISHETYFSKIGAYRDQHEKEKEFLRKLHRRSFDQWIFELEQGFNICVYGWGSKRDLLLDFAAHLSHTSPDASIVVLNGYNVSLTPRDFLSTLASTIPSLTSQQRLGAQPLDVLSTVLTALSTAPPAAPTTLLIHSIDGPSLRRPATQSILARLASTTHIHILASADTPNFPLLWDATLRSEFNWVFHDATTFRPFDAEIAGGAAGGPVDEALALLGRSGRKVHGREGVMYVLRSLTANARSLFALLVAELLSLGEDHDGGGGGARIDDDDDNDNDNDNDDGDDFGDVPARDDIDDDDGGDATLGVRDFEASLAKGAAAGPTSKKHAPGTKAAAAAAGRMEATIPYRALYQKAVSQFIATNELSFRELLKEFHDHEMVFVRRHDAGGGAAAATAEGALGVPFRREEMEVVLAELMGADV